MAERRTLYVMNARTRKRGEERDVTGLGEWKVLAIERELLALVDGEEWVVRDSANGDRPA